MYFKSHFNLQKTETQRACFCSENNLSNEWISNLNRQYKLKHRSTLRVTPLVHAQKFKQIHMRENFWGQLWHAKCSETIKKKKLGELKTNDFCWIYQITELTGKTATPKIWRDSKSRVTQQARFVYLEPKLLCPKLVGTLYGSFSWHWRWLWTSMGGGILRSAVLWGFPISVGSPPEPSRVSLWNSEKPHHGSGKGRGRGAIRNYMQSFLQSKGNGKQRLHSRNFFSAHNSETIIKLGKWNSYPFKSSTEFLSNLKEKRIKSIGTGLQGSRLETISRRGSEGQGGKKLYDWKTPRSQPYKHIY